MAEITNQVDMQALQDMPQLLASLSEEERQLAVDILREYAESGQSELLAELTTADFDEVPVEIETFLHERKYLGAALYDAEGRFTVFPYWEAKLKELFPDNVTTAYNTVVLTGSIGIGKAQPLTALVLTEHGFKQMGSLTLQDKVFGNDGKLHKILGIFPQGKKQICRVTFTDGTSTLCCDEHLWTVYNITTKKWATVETKQLANGSMNLHNSMGHRYKIPMTAPVQFNSQPISIDPYLLGVLLGDGCLGYGCTSFATADQEILDNIQKNLLPNYELHKLNAAYAYSICKQRNTTEYNPSTHIHRPTPNFYTQALASYGLAVGAKNKHIPKEYLMNDVDTRIALLQGLMDTDGHITKDGSNLSFTTVSEDLKTDFIFLVQSLGGTCRIHTKQTKYYNKKYGEYRQGKLAYTITIRLPKNIKPFRLSRKLNRMTDRALEPYRYIKSIDYLDQQECQCIYIDNKEHLYLTNDFIVTHNTLVADLILLYMLYRLLCLKDPYTYYGMQLIDKLSIAFMNITIDNAKGVALDKMNQMLLSSEWFMAHGKMHGKTNLVYRPEKHIELIAASSNNQVIGRALFASFEDEVNFSVFTNPEKQKKKMMKLITQIDARQRSRFMRGTYLPTINIIASSADTEQSFLVEYIDNKIKNDSKTTLIVNEPQWVVDPRKDSPRKFWVGVGNKFLANELLPLNLTEEELEEYRNKGYQLWQVPWGYLEAFQLNIDEAICSIIGISTASSLKYISGVKLNEAKVKTYVNPFTKDVITVGNDPEDHLQYANFFDLSVVNEEDKARPLFIHLDMSLSGDKTGIAGIWVMGRKTNANNLLTDGYDGNTAAVIDRLGVIQDDSNDLYYKLAFSVSIQAPKGSQISFAKHRAFIRWLREQGFAIKGISSDTWGASQMHQDLQAEGFKTMLLSVDRLTRDPNGKAMCLPYQYLKTALYERRLILYAKCDLLTDELVGLERKSDGHIDHTKEGVNSKDQADAVCGALYNASQFSEEFSYAYDDHLETMLDVNEESTSTDKTNQMYILSTFQQELEKVYSELDRCNEIERQQQQESYIYYNDISDGIIAL